ncbi:MAG: 50S ribosomal protein L17 [Candidatus Omnitrophota bacterium]|nr:50S ribosomal protein L17 [Candidatus Omnitrophota bacterium]
MNKTLGRNKSGRLALVRDLAKAALSYESITTTKAKAKQAKKLVERLISLGKEGSLKSRRFAYRELCSHKLVSLLFNDIAKRFQNINGGYTRIYSLLNRRGDGTQIVVLELTQKREAKAARSKVEKKEELKSSKESKPREEKPNKEEVLPPEEVRPQEKEKLDVAKIQEKPKPEEKSAPPLKEKPKHKEIKPPTKFLGGLRKFFKKERDSL